MTELISKEAVGEIIAKFCERQAFTMTELIRAIDKLPTVNAEQKRGEWIHEHLASTSGGSYSVVRCSECKCSFPMSETNYCPNCGAYMRGGS